jgi:2-dehydropantoate 2-reductase
MTSYAVIGTGGVGGFYGIHLARTGSPVHFLIRSATDASAPLTLRSGEQEWTVAPGPDCVVHRDLAAMPEVDVVLVAVKATANTEVAGRIGRLVRPDGAVVLLQNGIDCEPAYAAALPSGVELAGGLAFLASHRESPSTFVHVDYGALALGRFADGYAPAPPGPWMAQVAADLGRADVPVTLVDDLLAARWQKLVWNIPFNGLSVLLDARTDALMGNEAARRLINGLMAEVIGAAAADGRELPANLAQQMLSLTAVMKTYAPSMKLDHDAGRPMEIEAMYSAAVARARRAGFAMPRTGMLADALTFMESR